MRARVPQASGGGLALHSGHGPCPAPETSGPDRTAFPEQPPRSPLLPPRTTATRRFQVWYPSPISNRKRPAVPEARLCGARALSHLATSALPARSPATAERPARNQSPPASSSPTSPISAGAARKFPELSRTVPSTRIHPPDNFPTFS